MSEALSADIRGMLIGKRFGKIAEVFAGIALCALCIFILFEHLTA